MSLKIMDFKTAVTWGALISKDYAAALFELLVNYRSVSASEAASRLDVHIQTAQDFLETAAAIGIIGKEEVYEGKRPYFRYALKDPRVEVAMDLQKLFGQVRPGNPLAKNIREKKNAGARFAVGRDGSSISSVAVWIGDGRERRERKLSLTHPQGRFLFHLPFPSAEPLPVTAVMEKAGVDAVFSAEIIDLVEWLAGLGVIEVE